MKTYLSQNIDGDYSVVKESLTARVAPHAATIRESRIVRRSGTATIRKFRIVRFFQLASYSDIPNSLNAVIRNFRITDPDHSVCLTPSTSMGLECPAEVRV